MKIEKINDNQIRCTLNKTDLASRQIKISELAYGTDKAKNLFRDMMQQAAEQFGFEAEDIPLMIEAIPASTDTIILIITKVEDPEELDTRFSKFSSVKEDNDFDALEGEVKNSFGIQDFLAHVKSQAAEVSKNASFTPLNKTLAEESAPAKKPALNEDLLKTVPKDIVSLFVFDKLDTVIHASHISAPFSHGKSSLYKDPVDDIYYLLIGRSYTGLEDYAKLISVISEYGSKCNISYAAESYLKEHFEVIIPEKAIQKLDLVY